MPQDIVTLLESAVAKAQAIGDAELLTLTQTALATAQAFAGGSTLPAYVPPVGKFAEFTLNKPTDAGLAAEPRKLANWCGATFISDYSAHGGVGYYGGGEHYVHVDRGGVLVLNIETRMYELRCLPSSPQSQPIWVGIGGYVATGTGAVVNSTLVQLPSANLASLVQIGRTYLYLKQATNGTLFQVVSFDDVANTVTVSVAPTGTGQPFDWLLTTYNGPPTDVYGGWEVDSGYPSSKHTYNCVQEFPAAWGGGPKGSLVSVAKSGGFTDEPLPDGNGKPGLAATWRFDLSQTQGGVTRMTGNQIYRYDVAGVIDATTNDAPNAGIDRLRQGWWSKARAATGDHKGMCFTSKDGVITRYPLPPQETAWAQIHHFEDEDLLGIVAGYNTTNKSQGIFVSTPPDKPGAEWVKVQQTGLEEAIAPVIIPYDHPAAIGYMGMRWCSHPNYQCFIGIPNWLRIDDTHVKVLLLTPPPVGQRKTGVWKWTSEVVESHDGSVMKVMSGLQTDHAIQNGSFGKLVYCEALRSLVWTRRIDQKGQLIRLARMD